MLEQTTTNRILYVGFLSSLVAGLIAGISARIVMRMVAVRAHLPEQFTIATLNILFFGLIAGTIVGFLKVPTARRRVGHHDIPPTPVARLRIP